MHETVAFREPEFRVLLQVRKASDTVVIGELALRTESHFREVLSLPSQRLTSFAFDADGDASIACFKEANELLL